MLKTVQVVEPKEVASTMECDGCHKVYDFRNKEHLAEINEFICLHRKTGPGSIVGEGLEVHMDLCQHCVEGQLSRFITMKNPKTQKTWLCMVPEGSDDMVHKAVPVEDDDKTLLMPFPGLVDGNPQVP